MIVWMVHNVMEQLIAKIKIVAYKYSNIYKIILFGSRARGDFRGSSDIDLAIFSKCKSSMEAADFTNDIEKLDTLFKFDLVFINSSTDENLLDNINKEGMVIMERLSNKLHNFKNAVNRLGEALLELKDSKSSVVRDGVIQRFEFTTELAWKATREYLIDQGFVEINSPKAVMKEAFSYGLIKNDEIWIQILNDRNLTSHIYKEDISIEICNRIIATHFNEFNALSERLEHDMDKV